MRARTSSSTAQAQRKHSASTAQAQHKHSASTAQAQRKHNARAGQSLAAAGERCGERCGEGERGLTGKRILGTGIALRPLINSLATAPTFLAITEGDTHARRMQQLRMACTYRVVILVSFLVGGR